MVLKLTFSVDYEDARPLYLPMGLVAQGLPSPKYPPPPPKFSHNIYLYLGVTFYFTHSYITKTLKNTFKKWF